MLIAYATAEGGRRGGGTLCQGAGRGDCQAGCRDSHNVPACADTGGLYHRPRAVVDGTFEFYIPGMEDDYAVVVGKLAGNAGKGSYKYKSGACSGTMTLYRSQ